MKLAVFLSLATLALSVFAAAGEATSTRSLIAEALQKNPEIRFYEAEIAAALGGRQAAGQLANPELSTELGSMNVHGQGDGLVWRAEIAQAFDFPGRLSLRKAIADRDIALAGLGLAQFKAQLANEVSARAGDMALLQRKQAAARSVRERVEALASQYAAIMAAGEEISPFAWKGQE